MKFITGIFDSNRGMISNNLRDLLKGWCMSIGSGVNSNEVYKSYSRIYNTRVKKSIEKSTGFEIKRPYLVICSEKLDLFIVMDLVSKQAHFIQTHITVIAKEVV